MPFTWRLWNTAFLISPNDRINKQTNKFIVLQSAFSEHLCDLESSLVNQQWKTAILIWSRSNIQRLIFCTKMDKSMKSNNPSPAWNRKPFLIKKLIARFIVGWSDSLWATTLFKNLIVNGNLLKTFLKANSICIEIFNSTIKPNAWISMTVKTFA